MALIGPHVGRLCRGAHDWMGPGKWTPFPVGMWLLQVTVTAPRGAMHKVAFPSLVLYLCCSDNTAIFRLLNVVFSSACSIFQLPFVGFFFFLVTVKCFGHSSINTFSKQKHWPYMVRSWMTCSMYIVIKEWVGEDCGAGKREGILFSPVLNSRWWWGIYEDISRRQSEISLQRGEDRFRINKWIWQLGT